MPNLAEVEGAFAFACLEAAADGLTLELAAGGNDCVIPHIVTGSAVVGVVALIGLEYFNKYSVLEPGTLATAPQGGGKDGRRDVRPLYKKYRRRYPSFLPAG